MDNKVDLSLPQGIYEVLYKYPYESINGNLLNKNIKLNRFEGIVENFPPTSNGIVFRNELDNTYLIVRYEDVVRMSKINKYIKKPN